MPFPRFVIAIVSLALPAAGCHTAPAARFCARHRAHNPAESKLAALYDQYVAKYRPLLIESEVAWWEANITGTDRAFQRQTRADNALVRLHSDRTTFATLKTLREDGQVKDLVLKRLGEVMYRAFLPAQGDPELQKRIVTLQAEATQIFNTHRSVVRGQEMTENDVRQILSETTDSALAEAAWKGYMQVGAKVEKLLAELVELRNRQARLLGYDNFYNLQLDLNEIDRRELSALFDQLDELTRETFAELKGKIDAAQAHRFGISPAELRPWHYSDLFFQEAPPIEPVNLDDLYRDRDLLALARRYYASLGMPVADVLDRSDLYEKPGKSPHAFSTDIDRDGDVRILCNLKPNAAWMDTLLHELGHAVYDQHLRRDLPFVLRTASHGLTTEGMALLFGAMSKNEEFLTEVLELPPDRAVPAARAARNTLRTEKIVFSRWAQVMVRFEQGMYSRPDQDLGKLWWDLKKRYQLLNPPEDTSRPDYGAKNHIVTTPVYYHNYVLGDLFASQLHHYLARRVVGTDDPQTICFYGRKDVGAFLKKKVFGPGNLYSWNELTERATGEPLTARYFAETFVD